jgi:hypothetical protein
VANGRVTYDDGLLGPAEGTIRITAR